MVSVAAHGKGNGWKNFSYCLRRSGRKVGNVGASGWVKVGGRKHRMSGSAAGMCSAGCRRAVLLGMVCSVPGSGGAVDAGIEGGLGDG